jgi:hypothetical protein
MEVQETASSISQTTMPYVEWTNEHEGILVDWADKALCYRMMHEKANNMYARRNTWFTIPVIIMSTLTGTANFAQDRIPEEYVSIATMLIGGVNLVAGIITTIHQFLKISELNEAHRVSAISWGKFYRNVKVELSKSPAERTPVLEMLKHCKEEFDRLIETSPALSDAIVQLFISIYSGGEMKYDSHGNALPGNAKQIAYAALHKPEVCDVLTSTSLTVYRPKEVDQNKLDRINTNLATTAKELMEARKNHSKIEEFIIQFETVKKRPPTIDEIITNLEHPIPVEVIESVLHDFQDKLNKQSVHELMYEYNDSVV